MLDVNHLSSSTNCDIQVFTGSLGVTTVYNWMKPRGVTMAYLFAVGGAGGGGGGLKGAGGGRGGGGSGGYAGYIAMMLPLFLMPNSLRLEVGGGGAGGGGFFPSDGSDGSQTLVTDDSSRGLIFGYAGPGLGGKKGGPADGGAGGLAGFPTVNGAHYGILTSLSGPASCGAGAGAKGGGPIGEPGAAGGMRPDGSASFLGDTPGFNGWGGAGAGLTSGGAEFSGGGIVSSVLPSMTSLAPTPGAPGSVNGGDAPDALNAMGQFYSFGGAGGASSFTAAGGSGGHGSWGSSGGGGGAGTTIGGSGGNGGSGLVIIACW